MDKEQLIEAIAFHLKQLNSNHATVVGMDIVDAVRECAIALEMPVNTGAYDQKTATIVLYN